MPVYQVSYVVIGADHPGAILLQEHPPQVGEQVRLGDLTCTVEEVIELLPPQGGIIFLHVTCRPTESAAAQT